MDDRVSKYLYDILSAINETLEETDIRGRKFEILVKDRVYRKFVERNIGIIGEAMNRVLKIDDQIPITSARSIVNTRNLVIHSYDSLDKEIIWGIIIKHLPILKSEVEKLMS
ncbi:MAG: DUF86 domain-containing protein [Muribaculaceae bacterium]|nr:DUF86 domain-containing protein [Muribaculaceae bacterium]